jgi:outer membrane protein OmpA-like peptidoglycan-associated protein
VFRNYEAAVEAIDAEILYTCNQEKYECAKSYAGPIMQKASGLNAILNVAGRYLLARVDDGDHVAYVAIAVGPSFTDIHVIEVRKMDDGMVSLDAAALGNELDARGYVIVEGIFFDTDKASLKAESAPAILEMAKLLKSRPDLRVYVVGHTDMQGDLDYNRNLSQNRAQTVVEALATQHGIARTRIEGHGVGPLAPQASNGSDTGRAKNRRVVLVAR